MRQCSCVRSAAVSAHAIALPRRRYVFGVKDTLMCLDMGAVETLLVWESLDCDRYELKHAVTGAQRGTASPPTPCCAGTC